eukprot:XP_011681468.1 PREDICTED: uncharacterized protein LOC105446401 [Strongylocentrotus purpuratus]
MDKVLSTNRHIATKTPGIKYRTPVPRLTVSDEDFATVGRINIKFFKTSIYDCTTSGLPADCVPCGVADFGEQPTSVPSQTTTNGEHVPDLHGDVAIEEEQNPELIVKQQKFKALKKIMKNDDFCELAMEFSQPASDLKETIISAGEKAHICLYGGDSIEDCELLGINKLLEQFLTGQTLEVVMEFTVFSERITTMYAQQSNQNASVSTDGMVILVENIDRASPTNWFTIGGEGDIQRTAASLQDNLFSDASAAIHCDMENVQDVEGSLSVAVVYNEMVTDAVDDDAFDIEVTE